MLTGESRISPRTAIAKPLSAAVAIGTGGPFGAEGPIIVTGGAVGSLLGQVVPGHAVGAQDPPRVWRGGRHGRGVRRAARVGDARGRAAAVRVLDALARPARSCPRASPRACTPRSSAPGPLFHVPPHEYAGLDSLWVFALLGAGVRRARGGRGARPVPRSKAAFRRLAVRRLLAPAARRARVREHRAVRAPRARRRLRVDQRRARQPAGGRHAWRCCSSPSSPRGGSRSRRERRAARSAPILLISGCFGGLMGALVQQVAPGTRGSPRARSRSSRWQPRSGRRPARRSPRSCSRSS